MPELHYDEIGGRVSLMLDGTRTRIGRVTWDIDAKCWRARIGEDAPADDLELRMCYDTEWRAVLAVAVAAEAAYILTMGYLDGVGVR